MKYLITGGCGFLGSNIAREILAQGHNLTIVDNLSRFGSNKNLEWLKSNGSFDFFQLDVRNNNDLERIISLYRPDVIYHLAGQVAMTTSIENPRLDFEINTLGTFNLLEAVRKFSPNSIVIYSSSNKVYGDLEQFNYIETETRYECLDMPKGFDESVSLNFQSPYGVSKGSADQYVLDYARIYRLKTVVFRHSSMFGGRQYATFDQGWIGWFVQKGVEIKNGLAKEPFSISGNGKQVRDLLYSSDCVSLYLSAINYIDKIQGHAFNIGGGIENSSSLLELFQMLELEMGIKMNYIIQTPRQSDQKVFVANCRKAQKMLNWKPKVSKIEGIIKMIEWVS